MVASQAKRKKTEEMPDSPPKRVTRARSVQVPDDAPAKPKTTKITTASTKVAAQKKKATVSAKAPAPAKTTKRKTAAENEKSEGNESSEAPTTNEPVSEEQPEPKQTNTKGRQRKTVPKVAEEIAKVEAPKARGRQTRATAGKDSTNAETTKARGRPKKAPEPPTSTTGSVSKIEEAAPEPVKKATRGRAAASTAQSSSTKDSSKVATVPVKKRVKFEDGHDKENIPIEPTGPKKSAMKATGLNAKPVRKPAATRATTRGRKAPQPDTTSSEKNEKAESLPLSPKKVNQVAKSDPISEDELAGEKTPIRALSKSPTKGPLSPIKDFGSVSKLNFGQHVAPSSPAKPVSESIVSSPARRPPPSPFKDSLKASPKKLDLGVNVAQPVSLPSRTPIKASLLQESPKKGAFAGSAIKSVLLPSKSPFKASLLQSPARRLNASPMKFAADGSPKMSKQGLTPETIISPTKASPVKASIFSPEKAVSSCFKADRSPEQRNKVHVIMEKEQHADITNDLDDLDSSLLPQSPGKEQLIDIAPIKQGTECPDDILEPQEDPMSIEPVSNTDQSDVPECSDLPGAPVNVRLPAFSIGSSSLRRISMESESSEDELASPRKIYEITPLKHFGISTKDFGTPAVIGGHDEAGSSSVNLSFSPLADQLSSWKTTSPDKHVRPRQTRGMFSFGGATISPAVMPPTRDAFMESPPKASFFDDEMAIRNGQDEVLSSEIAADNEDELAALKISQDSIASEEYGDENAIPDDPAFVNQEQDADHTMTCIPAKVFTPARVTQRPGEVHTVCKVPLRQCAEETPLQVPRQRSRSFGGPLATFSQPLSAQTQSMQIEQPATPVLAPSLAPQTPSSGMKLDSETPGRTVRKGVMPDVLKGAVVHVDVHTTEGADASGIFVDLLTQMGARCVKQWHWNPRVSMGSSLDNAASPEGTSPDVTASKIGITHVVYKDGGKRTLEKVRSSNGVVHCVGVGWVLE